MLRIVVYILESISVFSHCVILFYKFCRLLEPRPECVKIMPSGHNFDDF